MIEGSPSIPWVKKPCDSVGMRSLSPVDRRSLKQALPRRKFTPEEDMKLRALVESIGTQSWEDIARFIPDRSARQCRDRYKNYLLESLVRDPWTPEEDALVVQKFHQIGPKWVEIGKMLSGRSGNNVKNRWHKHLCKRDEVGMVRVHDEVLPKAEKVVPAPEKIVPFHEKVVPIREKVVPFREKVPQPGPVPAPVPHGEWDWPHLFNTPENPFILERESSSGFPLGDSLF
jgi:hypothetical protein